jgi:hypothetical protein
MAVVRYKRIVVKQMKTLVVTIPDELDAQLRNRNRRKGDLSRMVSEALTKYFEEHREP